MQTHISDIRTKIIAHPHIKKIMSNHEADQGEKMALFIGKLKWAIAECIEKSQQRLNQLYLSLNEGDAKLPGDWEIHYSSAGAAFLEWKNGNFQQHHSNLTTALHADSELIIDIEFNGDWWDAEYEDICKCYMNKVDIAKELDDYAATLISSMPNVRLFIETPYAQWQVGAVLNTSSIPKAIMMGMGTFNID